jgi:hypothetical protein
MMKAPTPGRVKTRLAATLGAERAAELYRRFVEHLARTLLADPERPWRPVVAFDPPSAESELRAWLAPICSPQTLFMPQAEGDLGARLRSAFARAFAAGAPSALAIGADCLEIAPDEIAAAFDALRSADVALGPTADGGYWTIGLSAPRLEIFDDMPWSQPSLAEATRRRAGELGLQVSERPRKSDIDEEGDLARLPQAVKRVVGE